MSRLYCTALLHVRPSKPHLNFILLRPWPNPCCRLASYSSTKLQPPLPPPSDERYESKDDNEDGDVSATLSDTSPESQSYDPLSVAIVGSGPSGFYAAKYLLSSLASVRKKMSESDVATSSPRRLHSHVEVDILERLPFPFGLVRYGVAPDHPEVKNVQHDFERIIESHPPPPDAEVIRDSVAYFGNVAVGSDDGGVVSLEELRQRCGYDAVVLATGAADDDRTLGIKGENLAGVLSARRFVHWYNGHVDYADGEVAREVRRALRGGGGKDRDNERDESAGARVVVIGNGNVALDCARVLAKGGTGMIDTDLTADAADVLGGGVGRITVAGRRGHGQAAFTIKEIRELTKLDREGHDVRFVVCADELDVGLTPSTREELASSKHGGRPRTRIDKLLRSVASNELDDESPPSLSKKELHLRFLLSPVKFLARLDDSSRVGSVVFERNMLVGGPGEQRAEGTGELFVVDADLVLVSIGYRGLAMPGTENVFDTRSGRVRSEKGGRVASYVDGGLYATGWIRRGATGIIGTNLTDAKEVASAIVEDILEGSAGREEGENMASKGARRHLRQILQDRGIRYITWEDYKIIDAHETNPANCRTENQPRKKITSIDDVIKLIK